MNSEIQDLHDLYGRLTGLQIRLDMSREMTWCTWRQWIVRAISEGDFPEGYRPADALTDVVSWLRGEIRAERRRPESLRFRNLVGNPDWFEEDLAMARARRRAADRRPPPNKAAVLQATGRPPAVEPPAARPAGEILSSEGFREFSALANKLREK